MAENYNYSLKGIGPDVELGEGGPRLVVNGGKIEARTNDGLALAPLQGEAGTGPDDFVTYTQLALKADQQAIAEHFSSGVKSGGVVTPTSGVSFEISAGIGYVLDNGILTRVTWTLKTGACQYNGDNYVGIDKNGNVVVSNTEPLTPTYIRLGYFYTNTTNTAILTYNKVRDENHAFLSKIRLNLNRVLGPLVGYGFDVAEGVTPKTLTIDAGEVWNNINELVFSQTSNFTKIYYTTDNGWVVNTSNPNVVDVLQYNNITQPQSTALVALGTNKWKKDHLLMDLNGVVYYVYGQAEYNSEEQAAAAPLPTIPNSVLDNTFYLCSIVVEQDTATIGGRIYDLRPMIDRIWVALANMTTGTVTSVAITGSTGLTVGGSPITDNGTITLTLDQDLQAVSALTGSGLAVRTADNTWALRTITGTANNLTVTNGDGVAGNPTLAVVIPGIQHQIIYNNDGILGASADFTWDNVAKSLYIGGVDADIILNGITNEPTPASAGQLKLYAKSIAGRMLPKFIGPSGLDMPIQPGIAFNRIGWIAPNNTTTVSSVNLAPTTLGTVSTPTLASTNYKTQMKRTLFRMANQAGNLSGIRSTATEFWRGNTAGQGGFFFVARFALDNLGTNNRAFMGIVDVAAAPTNIDPLTSTTNGKIGMAINTNTGNWQLVHNVAGTAPTVIDLGANFPVDTTTVYELTLFSAPNGANVQYRIVNLVTGAQTSGTISTNLPANTVFYGINLWMTNNANTGQLAFSVSKIYLETDS